MSTVQWRGAVTFTVGVFLVALLAVLLSACGTDDDYDDGDGEWFALAAVAKPAPPAPRPAAPVPRPPAPAPKAPRLDKAPARKVPVAPAPAVQGPAVQGPVPAPSPSKKKSGRKHCGDVDLCD
ncbi:hypothetical protein ACPCSP_20220 [Streptomyces cinereoruber]|uniref:hypothetical protein n=1 Tax=Streptomyces cinereoruber TaxID=67260 RepID=UPI003C2E3E32